MTWAPDYTKLIQRRLTRLNVVRSDALQRAAHLKFYETHPVEFIEDWFVTYDPRRQPAIIPFALFPKQREFILWLWARYRQQQDAVVEKSRDMGVTWLCVAFSIWLWRFHGGVKAGFGSRKEMLVDRKDDPDSIFEKARIILRHLPREFAPVDFDLGRDCPYLRIVNVQNGSVITGEAGDQIGRGGRSSIYFKDESAFYERPHLIEAALSNNSDCKIDVSTPNGVGNPFFRKRHSGKVPVFTFHWRDDPRKDDAWYQRQCDTLEPHIRAQEIDIDYSASVEDIAIPARWVQAAIGFAVEPSEFGLAGVDVGGGRDRSVFIARFGSKVLMPIAWSDGDTTGTAYRAIELLRECKAHSMNFDSVGIGAGVASTLSRAEAPARGINVGEPPTDARWLDGRTAKEKFANLKAELWWKMRDRFQKTFEVRNGLAKHPPEELISLPDHPDLARELSLPRAQITATGKIAIESKESLARRGVKSPDFADALALTFAEGPTAAVPIPAPAPREDRQRQAFSGLRPPKPTW